MVGAVVAFVLVGHTSAPSSLLPRVSFPAPPPLEQVDRRLVGALTPLEPGRLPAGEERAILRLGRTATTQRPSDGEGHRHVDPPSTVALAASDAARLASQLEQARRAAIRYGSHEAAVEAGFRVAAAPDTGVGTHLVKWSWIDRPFDPAKPAMLLFDYSAVGAPMLVGLAYFVRSDERPEGFAGPNDIWHQHTGLCIVNGWVDREMSDPPPRCQGTWLAGADLWMLHAWVAPGWDNRKGLFAAYHPALCPKFDSVPDIERCEPFERDTSN